MTESPNKQKANRNRLLQMLVCAGGGLFTGAVWTEWAAGEWVGGTGSRGGNWEGLSEDDQVWGINRWQMSNLIQIML